jgi:hypothetical protein
MRTFSAMAATVSGVTAAAGRKRTSSPSPTAGANTPSMTQPWEWMWQLREAPKPWMNLTAPNCACALVPLPRRRWASMTRSRIGSTALTARGSRSRYQRRRFGTHKTHGRTGSGGKT